MKGNVEVHGNCCLSVRRRSLELEAERRVLGVLSAHELDFEDFVSSTRRLVSSETSPALP